jgi:Ubiquitin carboxyl-terminal hydrolase
VPQFTVNLKQRILLHNTPESTAELMTTISDRKMMMVMAPRRRFAETAVVAFICLVVVCCGATRISSGLNNLGNTCYLNSQIQCAYHIPLVRKLVLRGEEDDDDDCWTLSTKSSSSSASIVAEEKDGDNESFSSSEPPVIIGMEETATAKHLKIRKEEDSVALLALRRLFQDMDYSIDSNTVAAPRMLCSELGIPVLEQQDSQEFWKLFLPALQLPALSNLYAGTYQNYIRALEGGRERRRDERFLDISLDVTPTGSCVQESLQALFGQPELLTGDNAWRPEKGQPKVDAHKGVLLLQQYLPSILQLHFKRFQFNWDTETTTKLNSRLEFPSTLDLQDLLVSPDVQKCSYELQAVVVHMGEYESGHYYAYVRPDVQTNDWYRFNDEIVTPVTWDDVVRDAYGGKSAYATKASKERRKKRHVLQRLLGAVFGGGGGNLYGFGGPKANAYVLQYVRRCDIPKLYNVS